MKSGTQTKLEVADWGHEELKFGFWKVNVNILLHSTPAQLRVCHGGLQGIYHTHTVHFRVQPGHPSSSAGLVGIMVEP